MPLLYLSYATEDRELARDLHLSLTAMGHDVRYDEELLFIGSAWREHLLEALLESDAVVVLWSEATFQSQFVPAEIGAARARPDIGLLPVIVGGDFRIPYFLQDLQTAYLPPDAGREEKIQLAMRLHESVGRFIDTRDRHAKGRPKLFISHRHKDEEIVRRLVACIAHYFVIDRPDIRATSVRPYRLPVGENTGDRLRDEITDAEAVLGILTPDTLRSSYVAFELGSAWGQRVWTAPLLARGADQGNIPDPIRGLSPLFLTQAGDCTQLLGDMEQFTSLVKSDQEDDDTLGRLVEDLVAAASQPVD